MFHDTHGWQIKHYNSVKETSRLYNTWIIFDKQKQPNSSRNLLFSLSLPGFRNFMDPNKSKFQKRLWLIIVVCCCCLSIVQISERVYYFQQYPVSMTITFERSTDFYFPKICLCHFHSFLSNKIRERLNYSSYRSLNKRLLQHPNLTVDDLWKLTGYDLETFLIDCTYGKESCKNAIFWTEVMTIMGRCHVLTISQRVKYNGPSSRLRITLHDQELPLRTELPHLAWRLLLHDDTDTVQYESVANGIIVYKNSRSSLMYWYKKYMYENTPIKPCSYGEEMKKCHERCYDIMLLNETTPCRLPFMTTMDKFPLCTNEQFVKLNMFPVSNAVRYDIRKCGCINPCLEIAFDVQPDARRIQKPNVTLIEIFPSRPEIEIMKEIRSYTFASLISDIGGALGFYLGACILTCFEIVDCIIRMIIRQLVDKMNRPNQNIPKKIMM